MTACSTRLSPTPAPSPACCPCCRRRCAGCGSSARADRLTLAAYVATDGLRGAIAHLAESEYARLDPDGQRDVRSLLLRLAGPGEGEPVTRRRVARAELAALPRDPAPLVERLAAARLLTVSDDYVEVAHEALFREWPRLRGWLDDDRAGREVERRLAVAPTEWRAEDQDPALLWRGARLEAGLEVAADAARGDHGRSSGPSSTPPRTPRRRPATPSDGPSGRPAEPPAAGVLLGAASYSSCWCAVVAGGSRSRARDREAAAARRPNGRGQGRCAVGLPRRR